MSSRTKGRPSPAMVVSVIALSLALGGSAIAASDLTKKDVKKIAKKQAKKRDKRVKRQLVKRLATQSAYDETTASPGLGNGHSTLAEARVTTTTTSRVMATGGTELDSDGGGNDLAACRVTIDGVAPAPEDFSDEPDQESIVSVSFARVLPAGIHTARLQCREIAGNVVSDEANLLVWAVGT